MTSTHVATRPIGLIKAANARAGGHWFDPDTVRFFRSRPASFAYRGPGGLYFVTSERGPDNVRRYSVRRAIEGGKVIRTVGEFGRTTSRHAAHQEAKRLATMTKQRQKGGK